MALIEVDGDASAARGRLTVAMAAVAAATKEGGVRCFQLCLLDCLLLQRQWWRRRRRWLGTTHRHRQAEPDVFVMDEHPRLRGPRSPMQGEIHSEAHTTFIRVEVNSDKGSVALGRMMSPDALVAAPSIPLPLGQIDW